MVAEERSPTGFTLVEVLVALTLLATAVLGIAAGSTWAASLLTRAERIDSAAVVAASVLDSLRAAATPGPGQANAGDVALLWALDAPRADGLAHVRLSVHSPSAHGAEATIHALVGPLPAALPPLPED